MIQSVNIEFVAESVAGFVVRLLFLALLRGDRIVRLEHTVISHTHIFHSHQTRHVVEMIENILNGSWIRVLHKGAKAGDSDHSLGFCQLPDHLVGLAARMSWIESAAI